MAEQTAPKLVVQDTAEPPAREPTAATPAAPPTPGLDAPMRATAERLVAEAKDAGTPSIWICEDDPKPVGGLEPTPWPNAPSLPCPQAL